VLGGVHLNNNTMKQLILILAVVVLTSCGSSKIVSEKDITSTTEWLESNEANPIINVVQKVYANDDVEIIIKKKLTTDYVKIMKRNSKRIINKRTVKH